MTMVAFKILKDAAAKEETTSLSLAKLFMFKWDMLARLGLVDQLGSEQFERVKKAYIGQHCPGLGLRFIAQECGLEGNALYQALSAAGEVRRDTQRVLERIDND